MLSLIYYKVQNFLTVYPLLYAPTTERSEFKKYFSVIFILIGFFFNKYKFVFVLNFGQRGLWGECQKFKTPYSLDLFKILTIPLFASTSTKSLSFNIFVAFFVPIIHGLFISRAVIAA